MKYTEATMGRIFILRLEHGDRLPDAIEAFAAANRIKSAAVFFLGGADKDSRVVVGPEDGAAARPVPVVTALPGVSEAAGVGTLFPNEAGEPKLHLHAAFGRGEETIAGCTRAGVATWHIGEVIILELLTAAAVRKVNPDNGFELLEIEE